MANQSEMDTGLLTDRHTDNVNKDKSEGVEAQSGLTGGMEEWHFPKIAPNIISSQMGSNSTMSSQHGGISNMSSQLGSNSGMSSQMGSSSALPQYPLPPMGGGMGPSHVPYLFQNQLMYPQGGGYPPISGMNPMPYSSPITSEQEAASSTAPTSLSPTSSNMPMSSMPGMPSMAPMMGFPFAPYPFPMPQPYLMPGMDPSYMAGLPGHQQYNMHHNMHPGMHMAGSGSVMPPEYSSSKDYHGNIGQNTVEGQMGQNLELRHQDNSGM